MPITIIRKSPGAVVPPSPVVAPAVKPKGGIVIRPKVPSPSKPPEEGASARQVLKLPLDGECRAAIFLAPNAVIPWFLMASYLYYVHNESLLTDEQYDSLAVLIRENFDVLTHPHKWMVTLDDLTAGTLYRHKAGDYPLMVRGAACRLAFLAWNVKLDDRKDDDFDVK